MKLTETVGLIIILLFGLFLYLYKISEIPNGFYVDEAAPAYNAYSILLTGRDEYGKAFPLLFRSIRSYNTPIFIYSLVPSIALFGLNIFSVRLVSVLFGLASGIVFYFLIKSSGLVKTLV